MSGEEIEVEAPAEIAGPAPAVASADDGAARKAEEGTASAATSSSHEKKPCHRRKGCVLLFLLLVVGGAVGLGVGLATKNKNADGSNGSADKTTTNESPAAADNDFVDDAPVDAEAEAEAQVPLVPADPPPASPAPSPAPSAAFATALPWIEEDDEEVEHVFPAFAPIAPVIADRTCEYRLDRSVAVTAPGYAPVGNATVEKKLSGGASAFDGSTAVIVSYDGDGAAGAVWTLGRDVDGGAADGDAGWKQTGAFQTDDSDQLGWGVAIRGDTFVLGAPGTEGREVYLIEGSYWAGRGVAMVMTKDEDDKWYRQAVLSPKVANDNADFGTSVAIAECECLIAVGAWHDRDSRGSVYVFAKNSTGGWDEIQKLAPTDTRRSQSNHLHGNYGYTVAINDDYLAVKAPYDSYTESYDWKDKNRGVVYVYERGEDGTFGQAERLYTPEGKQVRTHLSDMAFLGNDLLVGAPGRNLVYVFERTGSEEESRYQKVAELRPSDGAGPESYFGVSLDVGGDGDVLVGSRGDQTSYLFSHEGAAWVERAKFDGFNTALAGETIVEHTPVKFETTWDGDGKEQYGGEVNFYKLGCDLQRRGQ